MTRAGRKTDAATTLLMVLLILTAVKLLLERLLALMLPHDLHQNTRLLLSMAQEALLIGLPALLMRRGRSARTGTMRLSIGLLLCAAVLGLAMRALATPLTQLWGNFVSAPERQIAAADSAGEWCLQLLALAVLLVCGYSAGMLSRTAPAFSDNNPVTVVIDAGHGGEDGGASSKSGVLESTINLEIAGITNDLLRFAGVRTAMVRTQDVSVYTEGGSIQQKKVSDLKNRVKLVESTPNALLLSIHQNFFTEGKYHGAQVFYAKTPGSQQLAEQLQSNLALGLEPDNHRQCKKSDGVYLMEHIDCTGVLVECGFLSNYEEEQRLLQPEYQKKLAAVIAGTLSVWLSEEHPNEI